MKEKRRMSRERKGKEKKREDIEQQEGVGGKVNAI